jgi:hypothetical protein
MRQKLTYANVMSTLCFFLLLGVVPTPLPNCRRTALARSN